VTWLKLDDQVTEHPKCVSLSCEAWTLWLHGLTYCSRNLTDGTIPDAILSRLSPCRRPRKAAAELVAAGLWERVENAHHVHDYEKHQRTKAEILDSRTSASARQKASRTRRQASNGGDSEESVAQMSQRDKAVTHTTCHSDVTAQETETETDTGTTFQSGAVGVTPEIAKEAAAIMARVRAEARRTLPKVDAEAKIVEAQGRVHGILEGHDRPPRGQVVSCLLGQPHNLQIYRRRTDGRPPD